MDDPLEHEAIGESFSISASTQSQTAEFATDPVCFGQRSLKFPLTYRSDGLGFRNELTMQKPFHNFALGGEYWLGFAIFLPSDWAPDVGDDILLQLHGTPDKGADGNDIEASRNPPIALMTRDDQWHVWVLYDSKKLSGFPQNLEGGSHFDLGAFQRGKWTEFVMHLKLSYGSDGLTEVWKDGQNVLRHQGGNAFNDDLGPYLKFGIYKPYWKNESWGGPSTVPGRLHYFDGLRIGDSSSSFAEVSPDCGVQSTAWTLQVD